MSNVTVTRTSTTSVLNSNQISNKDNIEKNNGNGNESRVVQITVINLSDEVSVNVDFQVIFQYDKYGRL